MKRKGEFLPDGTSEFAMPQPYTQQHKCKAMRIGNRAPGVDLAPGADSRTPTPLELLERRIRLHEAAGDTLGADDLKQRAAEMRKGGRQTLAGLAKKQLVELRSLPDPERRELFLSTVLELRDHINGLYGTERAAGAADKATENLEPEGIVTVGDACDLGTERLLAIPRIGEVLATAVVESVRLMGFEMDGVHDAHRRSVLALRREQERKKQEERLKRLDKSLARLKEGR